MSYTPQETREHRAVIGMDFLRFLMLKALAENNKYPEISVEELNKVLFVGGMPLVVPSEVNEPELKVIGLDKEVEE